jgi:hypothetical protein
VDQAGLAQVVEATIGEDLGTGLEPDGLGGSGLVQLGDEAAQSSQEGPPVKMKRVRVLVCNNQTMHLLVDQTTRYYLRWGATRNRHRIGSSTDLAWMTSMVR